MRIGIFNNKPYYLRRSETTLCALLERGHHLVLARPDRFERVNVPASLRKGDSVSTALCPHIRSDGLDRTIKIVRTARDPGRYLTPELRTAHASPSLLVSAAVARRLVQMLVGSGRARS
jgi:hypothetical protein